MSSFLNANMLTIFIPVFAMLVFTAVAVAILILCNEDDIESDKYYKARRVATQSENKDIERVATYHNFKYYCASEKCTSETYKFINTLYENLSSDFEFVPNVKVGSLISAFDDTNNYSPQVIKSKIDVGIFLKETMQPLVMVDLINKDNPNKELAKAEAETLSAIKQLKIAVCEVVTEDVYDGAKLKQELLKLMPADIKKKYSKD